MSDDSNHDRSTCMGTDVRKSEPVIEQAAKEKIRWADLIDHEFKAKKLNWADISEDLPVCSPASSTSADTDTVSTDAPSQPWQSTERASTSGNEASDLEQEQDPFDWQSPDQLSGQSVPAMNTWWSDEYWSWPSGDCNEHSFQDVPPGDGETIENWPADLMWYYSANACCDEQVVSGDMPKVDTVLTPLQMAQSKAMAAAIAHQRAVYEWSAGWWHSEGVDNYSAHQEACSKALAAARPHAKEWNGKEWIQFQ